MVSYSGSPFAPGHHPWAVFVLHHFEKTMVYRVSSLLQVVAEDLMMVGHSEEKGVCTASFLRKTAVEDCHF